MFKKLLFWKKQKTWLDDFNDTYRPARPDDEYHYEIVRGKQKTEVVSYKHEADWLDGAVGLFDKDGRICKGYSGVTELTLIKAVLDEKHNA